MSCTFVADQVVGDGDNNFIVEETVNRSCEEIQDKFDMILTDHISK